MFNSWPSIQSSRVQENHLHSIEYIPISFYHYRTRTDLFFLSASARSLRVFYLVRRMCNYSFSTSGAALHSAFVAFAARFSQNQSFSLASVVHTHTHTHIYRPVVKWSTWVRPVHSLCEYIYCLLVSFVIRGVAHSTPHSQYIIYS